MKLVSKEIFPTDARDKLVQKLGGIDNGVSDMRLALETAEAKCLELNEETNIKANDIICRLGDEKYVREKIINELNKELKFARRIILGASENVINKELEEYVEMLHRKKLTNEQS